ncbi:MAG TPA: trypsin-like serine protease [Polyangiaceae bacterium]|nr:trypsin-like serine protease [Polyangiaceae bacterium]
MAQKAWFWACAAVAVAGVGAPGARVEAGQKGPVLTAAPILGGHDAPDETAVIQFSPTDNRIACSAAVIAPNLVLTARHCLANTPLTFNCDPANPSGGGFDLGALVPAQELRVYLSQTYLNQPRDVAADARGKKVFSDPVANLCGHDVAIVWLDHDLPGRRRLPLRLTASKVNEPATAVGWGAINTKGEKPVFLQRVDTTVLALGPANYEMVPGLPLVTTLERELVVGKTACGGDSGSPLLSKETGAVIGTLSYLTNVDPARNEIINIFEEPLPWCTDGLASIYHTLEGRPFIEQAFAEAGHKLWREGEPEPLAFGQSCTSADQCDSGICVGAPGATICSRACDAGACPEGLQCADVEGRQVCTSGGAGGGPDPGGSAGAGVVEPPPTNPAQGGGGDDEGCQMAEGVAPAGASWAALALLLGLSRRRRPSACAGRRGHRL